MIVTGSSIGMESVRTYTSVSREAVEKGKSDNYDSDFAELFHFNDNDGKSVQSEAEEAEKSGEEVSAKKDFDDIFAGMKAFATSSAFADKLEKDAMDRIRAECIQYLLYLLFGSGKPDFSDEEIISTSLGYGQSDGISTSDYSVNYSYYYSESEETVFSTTGYVETADGRSIDFNLELTMSRSFTEYCEVKGIQPVTQFMDPLVINLDSPAALVEDVKVKFDIDGDGTEDFVNVLNQGSGYLAFDKNGDGKINDGTQLFGTVSGDGFADLKAFDDDDNGWIDEADEIFDKLTICFMNEDGTQELYKLKDKDVGAICLKSAKGDFSLNNLATNETSARIRSTGIFLYENGGIGTVQNLDLAQ